VIAELTLPPLYRAEIVAGEEVDARARACRLAREGADAATFVWRPDPDRLDCAVVLRPEKAGERVLPVALVAALALSDALGAVGPPAIATDLVWPGSVRVNGGLAGGIAVDLEPGAGMRDIPGWAVVAADLRIAAEAGVEGGERPNATCLEAEGFAGVGARELAEAFARHLLVWMDRWDEQGLAPISRHWLHRATARHADTVLLLGDELIAGTVDRLDEAGGLHLETSAGPRHLTLESWWRAES
jgi:biotin-(acetyl-CoA carboxylase) ligase